ncbi:MAG: hypothetical protein NUV96_02185 [Candidatus Colwellbacteria bacterium]|nr:hypothetical protein [Candidatus Colwellbacteria bacterium]
MPIEAEIIEAAYKQFKALLTPREKEVLTRYYGIPPHVRHSLAEIGEMYQVTRERIRQIKVEALKKLKIQ